tara:strand:+ start:67 stop:276 length:210 start_codon:yes stop_codon:yes gene_type:complete
MAKFELKFIDVQNDDDWIAVEKTKTDSDLGDVINVYGHCDDNQFSLWLDKSTAIKLAKTLRTEINKIQD